MHVTVHETSALTPLHGQCRNYSVLYAFNHRYSYIQSSVTFRKQPISIIFIARGFSKSETSRESGDRVSNLGLHYPKQACCAAPLLSYATHFWATSQFCELRPHLWTTHPPLELGYTLSYAALFWATSHSSQLRRTLLSYVVLLWASPHSFELRRTIMSFAALFWATPHPLQIRRIILSYLEAPFWATV
jgi:hypothetical protein